MRERILSCGHILWVLRHGEEKCVIVALEEAKRRLSAMFDVIEELGAQLRIEEARERAADLERETMVQDFWNDAEKSSKKLQEIKQLKTKVEGYEELKMRLDDAFTLCEMAIEANDEDSVEEVVSETDFIESEAEKKRIEVLLSGQRDTLVPPRSRRHGGTGLGIYALPTLHTLGRGARLQR